MARRAKGDEGTGGEKGWIAGMSATNQTILMPFDPTGTSQDQCVFFNPYLFKLIIAATPTTVKSVRNLINLYSHVLSLAYFYVPA